MCVNSLRFDDHACCCHTADCGVETRLFANSLQLRVTVGRIPYVGVLLSLSEYNIATKALQICNRSTETPHSPYASP
jgi:hypothetical protein